MKLRSVTVWRTRAGSKRTIRLYKAWHNLRGRLNGTCSKDRYRWLGKSLGFLDWQDFREWALSSGFKKGMELDRINNELGYSPSNLQWLTKTDHSRKTNRDRYGVFTKPDEGGVERDTTQNYSRAARNHPGHWHHRFSAVA